MKLNQIYLLLILLFIISCNKIKTGTTPLLKFQGSWFLRVYELDYTDTLMPGKIVSVKGNEVYKDFNAKIFTLLKDNKIKALDDSGRAVSYKKVCLGLINESLRDRIDTNHIDESDMFNTQLLGIELNDSIFLDIEQNKKQYFMHSINMFVPAEFNTTGGNHSIFRIMYNDLQNKGLDVELKAFENRQFARREQIFHPDGSITDEYTFYLTDAAGVEYYFRIPLEKLLKDDHNIENSILHYFKDDLVDVQN